MSQILQIKLKVLRPVLTDIEKKNLTQYRKKKLVGFVLSKHMYRAAVLPSNTLSFRHLLQK